MGHDVLVDTPSTPTLVQATVTAVREAQRSDPLARVTVVVPSFSAGRDLTRALAVAGSAGVVVRTPAQLVDELAAPALDPRAPLPFPLLSAAVQQALEDEPGRFEAVADEPVTVQAVASACARLFSVDPATVTPVTPLHHEVQRVATAALETTGSAYYTQYEALDRACAHLDRLGSIVLVAEVRGSLTDRRVVDALLSSGVRPVTGTLWPAMAGAAAPDTDAAVTGTHVVHAGDPDDEVRAVVRRVRRALLDGVPAHRIGLYYSSPDPYLRLLHRALAEAEITVCGPGVTGLGGTATARSLIRLLALDPAELPRAELFAVLAEGALRLQGSTGEPVSVRRAEILTRGHVPVIAGADWDRLAGYRPIRPEGDDHDERAEPTDDVDDPEAQRDSAVLGALHGLVTDIRARLAELDGCARWAEAAGVIDGLLLAHFRAGPELSAVRAALASLSGMDGLGPRPGRGRVLDAVRTRLDAVTSRHGEDGRGVAIGPLDEAVGRDLDIVCVLGMSEGLLPVIGRPDPLLPDGAVEPPPAEQLDERYRVLQLALRAGATERWCSFPRGSMRGGGDRLPSRWLLPTLRVLTGSGRPVPATDWADAVADCPRVTAIDSFATGVLEPPAVLGEDPATVTELRLRLLDAEGNRPDPGDDFLRRAHTMRRDRRRGDFTRFTGDVSSVRELLTVFDRPIAPTRLEDWAQSPYLFFLTTVLGVRPLPEPALVTEMDLLDYGTLVHTVLERYVRERIDTGCPPEVSRLREILDEESARALAESPGLLESLWRRREALLRADLATWADHDIADAEAGWHPTATELAFGADGDEGLPVRVPADGGERQIRLRGSVDRVDDGPGGLRVTDYKTGRPPRRDQAVPTAEEPTVLGTRFQLPLYALAASAASGGRPVVESRYWYCTTTGGFGTVSLSVDDDTLDRVRRDVGYLVEAVGNGWFPLKAGLGSSRELAGLLGAADLDRTWTALSATEPIRSHPAFRGIVTAGSDTEDCQ